MGDTTKQLKLKEQQIPPEVNVSCTKLLECTSSDYSGAISETAQHSPSKEIVEQLELPISVIVSAWEWDIDDTDQDILDFSPDDDEINTPELKARALAVLMHLVENQIVSGPGPITESSIIQLMTFRGRFVHLANIDQLTQPDTEIDTSVLELPGNHELLASCAKPFNIPFSESATPGSAMSIKIWPRGMGYPGVHTFDSNPKAISLDVRDTLTGQVLKLLDSTTEEHHDDLESYSRAIKLRRPILSNGSSKKPMIHTLIDREQQPPRTLKIVVHMVEIESSHPHYYVFHNPEREEPYEYADYKYAIGGVVEAQSRIIDEGTEMDRIDPLIKQKIRESIEPTLDRAFLDIDGLTIYRAGLIRDHIISVLTEYAEQAGIDLEPIPDQPVYLEETELSKAQIDGLNQSGPPYVRSGINRVVQHPTPEEMRRQRIEVILAAMTKHETQDETQRKALEKARAFHDFIDDCLILEWLEKVQEMPY